MKFDFVGCILHRINFQQMSSRFPIRIIRFLIWKVLCTYINTVKPIDSTRSCGVECIEFTSGLSLKFQLFPDSFQSGFFLSNQKISAEIAITEINYLIVIRSANWYFKVFPLPSSEDIHLGSVAIANWRHIKAVIKYCTCWFAFGYVSNSTTHICNNADVIL